MVLETSHQRHKGADLMEKGYVARFLDLFHPGVGVTEYKGILNLFLGKIKLSRGKKPARMRTPCCIS